MEPIENPKWKGYQVALGRETILVGLMTRDQLITAIQKTNFTVRWINRVLGTRIAEANDVSSSLDVLRKRLVTMIDHMEALDEKISLVTMNIERWREGKSVDDR